MQTQRMLRLPNTGSHVRLDLLDVIASLQILSDDLVASLPDDFSPYYTRSRAIISGGHAEDQ